VLVDQSPPIENRRVYPRRRLERLTYVELGVCNGGILVDTCGGGMRFQGVQPLNENQIVPFRFLLPGMRDFIEGTGQIEWVDSSGKGGGLQFIDVPEVARRVIQKWAESEKESAVLNEYDASPAIETDDSQCSPGSPWTVQQDSLSGVPGKNLVEHAPHGSVPSGDASYVESNRIPSVSGRTLKARTWALTALASAGAVLIVGALLLRQYRSQAPRAVSAGSEVASGPSLGLKAERNGHDWQVGWNNNADVLIQALGGHLTITDGSSQKEFYLDVNELRGGKILYTPVTDDVVVRLQLVTENLAQRVNESVRIVNGSEFQVSHQATTKDSPPHASRSSVLAHRPAGRPSFDRKSFAETSAAFRFTGAGSAPEKSGQGLEIAVPQVGRDSEGNIVVTDSAASRPILEAGVPALAPSLPIATSAPEPPARSIAPFLEMPRSDPAARRQTKPGGDVDPAQLMERRDPVYPKRLGPAIFGNVELHFKVGADGKVHDVRVVKGNPLLASAAVDAAKTWRYKPARLDGIEVETEATAVIVFKPN
jgi:TonB family protein